MESKSHQVIITTGYMGSGSSAVLDYLNEFNSYTVPQETFEFIFMHCPNGVFDLEDKLIHNNNGIRCDEALRSFVEMMQSLFDTPFWWVSDYKNKITPKFMNLVNDYVKSLVLCESDCYWWYQEVRGWKAFPRLAFNKIIRIITNGAIVPKKPLIYEGMFLSIPTEAEFYSATKKFLNSFYHELGLDNTNLILDIFIQPAQAQRFNNYFDKNVFCFIVDRDPRDVFLSNKYIWAKNNEAVPFPTNVLDFCDYYTRLRNLDKNHSNDQIHRIHFEDLVYEYDNTTEKINNILGITEKENHSPKMLFNPEKSINNTQLYLLPEFHDEAKIIEEKLNNYIYKFPYPRKPEFKIAF